MTDTVQVRSKRRRLPRDCLRFNLNDISLLHLGQLRLFYQKQLGRPVSTSLIVRRALEGLREHVHQMPGNRQAVEDEVMILLKHVL
ncbi:MAG: hypothetical protein AB1916_05635 [Thermodesulfobacteriota bacterium]